MAFHVDIHLFSETKGLGYDYYVGIPKGFGISYAWTGGKTYYWQYYDTDFQGWETRKGKEYSLLWIYSASYTDYSMQGTDEFKQSTTRLTWGVPGLNVQYENDYIHEGKFKFFRKLTPSSIKMGDDKGDRWRTSAVKIEAGLLQIGTNLFTGDPGPNGNREVKYDANGYPYYVSHDGYDPDKYRTGTFYVGISGIGRIGKNSEDIRDKYQNQMAHKPNGIPFFRKTSKSSEWYWYFGSGFGNSNW